jgi:hypothetical protein
MRAEAATDGLHGVPQLERTLSAVEQQELGQIAEQSVNVVIGARSDPHRRLAGSVPAVTLGHRWPPASRSASSPPTHAYCARFGHASPCWT